MGKRIITQRRGRGTSTYKSPSFRFRGKVINPPLSKELVKGKVLDLIHCPGHSAPLAAVQLETGQRGFILAHEGMFTTQEIEFGPESNPKKGNTLPLIKIPVGSDVYNIESKLGDGGKFMRAAGSSAKVVSKTDNSVTLKFKSKKQKTFRPECRATLGVVAGGGRKEKPIVKAGKAHHMNKAKNKLYPRTSGVAMNAIDHPFGSGRGRHIGKPKIAPRHAPPGRNVGLIRAKRTGKRK